MRFLIILFLLSTPLRAQQIIPIFAQREINEEEIMALEEIHFFYNKYSPYDKIWKDHLIRELKTPWEEWIPKTNTYQDASVEGKKQLMALAKDFDNRLSNIPVKIKIHQSEKLGYKVGSKYSTFHRLSRYSIPTVTFWIKFVEYQYQDYSWEAKQKLREYQRKKRKEKHLKKEFNKWVTEWVKENEPEYIYKDFDAQNVAVNFDTGDFYDYYGCIVGGNIWEEGFRPAAIAEKPKRKKLENPLNYLILRKKND